MATNQHGLKCPACGSDDVVATGTKGALRRTLVETFVLGGLIGALIGKPAVEGPGGRNIQYKCKACGHGFVPEAKPPEIQEHMTTACKIVFHRDKGFVGALRPFYVYLNGRQVGPVANGQAIEFTTNTKSNTITVTDAVGTAFKEVYRFEAAEGGLVTVHFNRKFS